MSFQRLFPSFLLPHFGHYMPAGKPPIVPVFWRTQGANTESEALINTRTGKQVRIGFAPTGAVAWAYLTGGDVTGGIACADIDKDGIIEVIFGSKDNYLYCLNGSGSLKWKFETGGWIKNPVTVKDVDKDGKMEIFFGSWDEYFYCLEPDGTLKWKKLLDGPFETGGCAVEDIDGDGIDEVVVGNAGGPPFRIYCFNALDGTIKWYYETGDDNSWTAVVVKDINLDGVKEVLCGSNDNYLYCLRGTDGALVWSYNLGDDAEGIATEDVDKDNIIEVIATSRNYRLRSLNFDGTLKNEYVLDAIPYNHHGAIADIDGDGITEILVCADGADCFDPTLTLKWKYSKPGVAWFAPILGDFDDDGEMEIFLGGNDYYFHMLEPDGTLKWRYFTGTANSRGGCSSEDVDKNGFVELLGGSDDDRVYCFKG